jgi:hypothetical protein
VTPSSPRITLAEGAITRSDRLSVEVVKPTDSPSFVLLVWPAAPTVTNANPKALANLAAAIVRLMGEAQAQLARIRREDDHEGRRLR